MNLSKPFQISPRLLPALHIGGAWVQLEIATPRDAENRTVYRWTIDLDGRKSTGADLRSGCGGGSLQSGFESLLSFLGAFAEADKNDGENGNLFPLRLHEWAQQNDNEIACLRCELEERPGLIS